MFRYATLEEDLLGEISSNSQDFWTDIDYPQSLSSQYQSGKCKKPLREKNNSGKNSCYKHVPHREKPPQVVAKRNARERRRVQAVNNAFIKLRNAVPIQNSRGKRISKVKTLLYAIDYIRALDSILQECRNYSSYDLVECGLQKNMNHDTSGNWCFEKDGFPLSKYYS